jgi:hypothetical protein
MLEHEVVSGVTETSLRLVEDQQHAPLGPLIS